MRLLAIIVAIVVQAAVARAEDLPDQRPILRIDPGCILRLSEASASTQLAI